MQIVIDIPKDEYNIAKYGQYGNINVDVVRKAIANGTPLPKGHGDLKDMGNLPYMFDLTREDPIYSGKDIERTIKSIITIIPADKEND